MSLISTALSLTNLQRYLVLVGGLRALSVGLGYGADRTLQQRVFTRSAKEFTSLQARTFAIWTATTCLITWGTAAHLHNGPLVAVCIATFLLADAFFLAELAVYKTVTMASISMPMFIASACGGCERGGGGTGAPQQRPPSHHHTPSPRRHVRPVAVQRGAPPSKVVMEGRGGVGCANQC